MARPLITTKLLMATAICAATIPFNLITNAA